MSASTIKSYKAVFRLLIDYLFTKKGIKAGHISFETLNTATIVEFLDWIEQDRGCGVTTRSHRLSVLSAFADYAQNRNFEAATTFKSSVSKVPRKKGKKEKRSFFSSDELKVYLTCPLIQKLG